MSKTHVPFVQRIIDVYLETGKPIRAVELAARMQTSVGYVSRAASAAHVHPYIDRVTVDHWTGDTFSGKYIQSPAYQPSLKALADMLRWGKE